MVHLPRPPRSTRLLKYPLNLQQMASSAPASCKVDNCYESYRPKRGYHGSTRASAVTYVLKNGRVCPRTCNYGLRVRNKKKEYCLLLTVD